MSDQITDTIRDDKEIGFGTVQYETLAGTSSNLVGYVMTCQYEETNTDAVVVWETDDRTSGGEITQQTMLPMRRVLRITYDWGDVLADRGLGP